MPEHRLIEEFMNNAGGVITSKQMTEAGFHRSILSGLVEANELVKAARGVYTKSSAWEDEMYLLQHRFSRGIFSHETALYLHGLTDRTPARFVMTFPWGYNAASLKEENVTVKRVIRKLYGLGNIDIASPAGSIIRVYDVERSLCDIVRGNNTCDIQIVNQAMKHYAKSKGKDIQMLTDYAEKLRVKPKIINYMEILL